MSITVDLPPGVELQLRLAASAEGLDVSTYVYETIAPRLRPSSSELMSQEELVAKVREDFPPSFWKRFASLAAKRDAGGLTSDEWREITAAEATEAYSVERLYYPIELGRRRGKDAVTLIKELGLRSGSDDGE